MGITKTFTDSQGNTWDYWKITSYTSKRDNVDSNNNYVAAELCCFKNQTDADAGKKAGFAGSINLFLSDFPLDLADENLLNNNPVKLIYNKIHEGALTGTVSLNKGEGKFNLSDGTADA